MRTIVYSVIGLVVVGAVFGFVALGGGERGAAPRVPAGAGSLQQTQAPLRSAENLRALLHALCAQDPEAALIEILCRPHQEAAAMRLLSYVGDERAAAALRQMVQDMQAGNRVVPGLGQYEDQFSLWMIEVLNGLPPHDQLAIITQQLAKIEAIGEPSGHAVWAGHVLLLRLADLALPESLPLLRKLVDEDAKVSHYPIAKEHWLHHEAVVQVLDRIDDPAGLAALEQVFPYLYAPRREHRNYASAVWWRLKLRTVPPANWPEVLKECIASATMHSLAPPAASNLTAAAAIIGPAAIPAMRSLSPNVDALDVLAELKDPWVLDVLVRTATDPSEERRKRLGFAGLVSYFHAEPGLVAALDILDFALAHGDRELLGPALNAVRNLTGFPVSDSTRARLAAVAAHPDPKIADYPKKALDDLAAGVRTRPLWESNFIGQPSMEPRLLASELKQQGRPFDAAAIASLREQLNDPDPYERYDAIWVLGWIGDYDSIPHLTACARTETDPKNMELLIETLSRLYLLRNLPK